MASSSVVVNPYEGLPLSDQKRWKIIYPAYLNSRKTIAEGRRVPKEKAVDNPLASEIKDVCASQQLETELEAKVYPRELNKDHIHSGRVRVQLKNDDGTYVNPKITSTKELYSNLCDLIPKLKSRQSGALRTGGSDHQGGGGGKTGGGGGKTGGGGGKTGGGGGKTGGGGSGGGGGKKKKGRRK